MAKPSDVVRGEVYRREQFRCIRCGRASVTFQHRISDGIGGSRVEPTAVDGLAACLWCNEGFEHAGQTEALAYGWKVRRWVREAGRVPVFNRPLRLWARLTVGGGVVVLQPRDAIGVMRSVYGAEWDRWVDALHEPVGMQGRTAL